MFPRSPSITKNTPKPHKTAPLSVSTTIPAPPPPPITDQGPGHDCRERDYATPAGRRA